MDRADRPGRRALKVGVLLPTIEGGMARETPRWADLLAMARRAEALGLDSLWIVDHFFYQMPRRERQAGVWECWSLLAALAAATSRVELGALVLCAGFRNPALLAKMADTVEEISGGRLILGLGAGWHEPEYAAFGYPFDHRVSRFAEALAIIHGLLHDGEIDFTGQYYEARECELRPRGPRGGPLGGGPPILIGTTGARMLRLTAQYADIWNAVAKPVEELPALRERVDAACREVGRDPATLERTVGGMTIDLTGEADRAEGARFPLRGSPEELAEILRAYAPEGITHLQVIPAPRTLAGIEAFARVLEVLDRG